MHTIGDFAQHDEDLQQTQEERDDAGIDQIGEHGADDGDDEERLHGVVVLIAYSALAIALGVAPRPKPHMPAHSTAAS